LEVEQAPIGRRLPSRTDLHNLPLNEIVFALTGETRADLLKQIQDSSTLAEFDDNDLHVLAAAVQADADAICSSDRIFDKVTWIPAYKPAELATDFGL
jgi:hypothetical protein